MGLVMAVSLACPVQAADVRVAYSLNPGSLPIFVAEERGLFASEGVTVQRVDCLVGRDCLHRLIDGQADLSTTADLPLVLAAFAGQRFAIVATINTSRDDTKIIARRSGAARSLGDLRGRRVATLVGTTAQYALDSQLLFEGVDPSSIQLVPLLPPELRPALLAHRVDAVAVFEPLAFELVQSLGTDALALGRARVYTQTWNLVGPPSRETAADLALGRVLRALKRACDWIAAEPAQARQLLLRRSGLGGEATEAAWPSLSFRLELRQSLLTTLESEARWAQRGGMVTGPPPNFLSFVDPSPLQRVSADTVTLSK